MSVQLIKAVNELFTPFYPYVAQQVAEAYGREGGIALEMGPYALGISIALRRLCPDLKIIVGDDTPGLQSYFRRKVAASPGAERIQFCSVDKYALPFRPGSLDLVYFRGGLFFWEKAEAILKESFRVLSPGGVALIGGGFGATAPDALIEAHLEESRRLNEALHKRRLSQAEVEQLLDRAELTPYAQLDHRHGLWAILRKPRNLGS